jgi:hypothetical protein
MTTKNRGAKKTIATLTKPNHGELAAYLPSGSGFDSYFRCLGKWEAEQGVPERESTPEQMRGERIHAALAKSDLSELVPSDATTASSCMYAEGKLVEKYSFEHAVSYWEPTLDKEWNKRHSQMLMPRLFDIDDKFNPLWSVQHDRVLETKDEAMMIDYKTGFGELVPIDINWQVKAQVASLYVALGERKRFIAALVHPHHPDSLYEVTEFTSEQAALMVQTIRGHVALIQQKDQPLTPGDIQCRWCGVRHSCLERKQWLLARASANIQAVKDRGYTDIIERTPDERGQHVRELKDLQDMAEHYLNQYVDVALKDPNAIKGWKLHESSQRSWSSEDRAIALAQKLFGEDVVAAAMKMSPANLEAAMLEKYGKLRGKEMMELRMGKLIVYKERRPWLVPSFRFKEA